MSGGHAPAAQGANRPSWDQLPLVLRAAVETTLGSTVIDARTQQGGFSPGPAVRLTLADGRRAFVKAAHPAANAATPLLHAREARILRELPAPVPAPRLIDVVYAESWIALCIEDIDGCQPAIPWQAPDLERVVGGLEQLADSLAGASITAPTLTETMGTAFTGFRGLARAKPDELAGLDPWVAQHLERLVALETSWPQHASGTSLLHMDLRADNILLTDDRVVFVDWAHAATGPAWFDLMCMLPSVAMQGGPAPWELFDASPLGQGASAEAADALLCALTGFFVAGSRQPAPPGLPTLREFQRAQGAEALAWLRRRLGW